MMSLAEYYLIPAIGRVVTYTTTIKLSGMYKSFTSWMVSKVTVSPLFVNKLHLINMAFNSEVALFNLLEDAQTSAELLSVIDDYLDESEEV